MARAGAHLPHPDQSLHLHALQALHRPHPSLLPKHSPTRPVCPLLPTHSPARVSLVHGVAHLAAALVAVGLVVAVLGLITVMMPVCTLVLRGAGQEGPGGPRTPTRQPWLQRFRASLGCFCTTYPPDTQVTLLMSDTRHIPNSAPCVLHTIPQPVPSPLQIPLTITRAAESTFHAVATPILAPPCTPATVRAPQAQGTLGCLSTAQGAALRSPEQPPTASSHTSKGQVGGAQTLSRGEVG